MKKDHANNLCFKRQKKYVGAMSIYLILCFSISIDYSHVGTAPGNASILADTCIVTSQDGHAFRPSILALAGIDGTTS